jgi:hypothetical protein
MLTTLEDDIHPNVKWGIKQVVDWATKIDGVDEEDAEPLKTQKINGEALLDCKVEDLERWGIKGGPAKLIFKALKKDDQGILSYLILSYPNFQTQSESKQMMLLKLKINGHKYKTIH